MKALFIHDLPLFKRSEKYFSVTMSAEIWKRNYLNVFDEMLAVTRCKEIQDASASLNLSSCEHVEFNGIYCDNLLRQVLFSWKDTNRIICDSIEQCDVAIVRLPSIFGTLAIRHFKKLKKPFVVEMVGCPWDAYWNRNLFGKLLAPFMWFITRKQLKSAPFVIYVTAQFLQKRYPTKGFSTNCSNVYLPVADNQVIENRIKLIESPKKAEMLVVGTTAAVDVRFKGQQYMIRALELLKKKHGDTSFEYQLVGSGNKTFLSELAKKCGVESQVKLLGIKDYASVMEWLDSIDIYIQPSRQEGLPRALIEAMSRGLPSCGAKTAGIPELLDDEWIFSNSKNEIKEIAALLLKMKSKGCRKTQALRNFEEAKKYESDKINARRTMMFRKLARQCQEQLKG